VWYWKTVSGGTYAAVCFIDRRSVHQWPDKLWMVNQTCSRPHRQSVNDSTPKKMKLRISRSSRRMLFSNLTHQFQQQDHDDPGVRVVHETLVQL
jgi:hypothetical protein